ncbi:uncharacterized protein LOC110044952 isoform X4 [Orbicella faveolata]|nr:uncharacterized protein LOC110044952 isoform X4 [Orbicella faveolata]XP_020606193.1 uncharacterized protein LOC110044952 isoform X4 [Orbicella faveolata]XP_020606194.1 uncharacterized protein LOC110044952 isoform X4 [Orbicella faveolata]
MERNGLSEITPSPKLHKKNIILQKHKDSTSAKDSADQTDRKSSHKKNKDQLDPDGIMSSPRQEKRSPFSLPKFGSGNKTLDPESLAAEKLQDTLKSEKKKMQKQQKTPDSARTPVYLVENIQDGVDSALKEVVTGILPISYEDEIVQKRTQILRDPLQVLLVFPEDDVIVSTVAIGGF